MRRECWRKHNSLSMVDAHAQTLGIQVRESCPLTIPTGSATASASRAFLALEMLPIVLTVTFPTGSGNGVTEIHRFVKP